MIEKTVLAYLAQSLGVPVCMEEPERAPASFVVVEKTGSSQENHVTHSTLAIQSYAPSLYQAAELNELVKQAMEKLAALNEIGRSRLNSDYNFTDTASKRYRYQAVFDITHY